jgi:hypothetical protein
MSFDPNDPITAPQIRCSVHGQAFVEQRLTRLTQPAHLIVHNRFRLCARAIDERRLVHREAYVEPIEVPTAHRTQIRSAMASQSVSGCPSPLRSTISICWRFGSDSNG